MSEWKPINTAPKDGTEILVVERFTNLRTKAFWDKARGGIWSEWPGRRYIEPILWMSLPLLPTDQIDENNQDCSDAEWHLTKSRREKLQHGY